MNGVQIKHDRILAVAPSTRGVGFAVLEGKETLVNWGVKSITGDKNSHSLARIKELITQYEPAVLVLEDCLAAKSRRNPRIRSLGKRIIKLATNHRLLIKLFSREQVNRIFFMEGKGTKHALAEMLAQRFPEELGFRVPPQRKPWTSEDCRIDMFDAVALALAVRQNASHRFNC